MNQTPDTTRVQPDYRRWHVPLARDRLTLRQALQLLAGTGAGAGEIPLLVQLVENPAFRIPGLDLFHGRVGLQLHDTIHILLGRGLLNKDEAFTIGFTMGSTRLVNRLEEGLFVLIASHLYPRPYRFQSEDIEVFRDALRLAHVMHCKPLDQIDVPVFYEDRLGAIRQSLGIDRDLLLSYYRLEKQRYPGCPASARLLNR